MKREPSRPRTRTSPRRSRSSSPESSSPEPSEIFSLSERETFTLGETLGRSLRGGETILLCGDLGTGKTVFARGLAAGLGIDPLEVGSPTFILVDRHEGRLTLFHADLYRLETESDMLDLGLDEFAAAGAVVVVEWGERLPFTAREGATEVRIRDLGDDSRSIRIGKPEILSGES